ncbi:MAG TPA: flavohemoglobin expression-modulating QEGLA motif protein [Xanthomonadaceae bacterium]|nr:flavohemoglobin expression-modulating QEGLA motif protein [Xanthomonadaceae bacterium]
MAPRAAYDRWAQLDARLVRASRRLRLLQAVSWTSPVQREFLERWRRGVRRLPEPDYLPEDHTEVRAELRAIAQACDRDDPLGLYLRRTAESWHTAALLLEGVGTAAVTEHSIRLFGRPGDPLPGGTVSGIDAAMHFVGIADQLDAELRAIDADEDAVAAALVRERLQQDMDAFFGPGKVSVELDPDLIAKAAAGPTRIRLRAGAAFSQYDIHQLREHEAFVHTLTALNGREQPHFTSLALTSPRIIATQEGLATFAELITGHIDIERMKRISLRILAIDMALRGADFIDVFRFFLDAGQRELESFTSAARIFRGVPVTGGAAFTKDGVYLAGLVRVHTFFRWCLRQKKLALTHRLFAGKMTLEDVFDLAPAFEIGAIAPPRHLPPWAKRANGLAGILAFSLFANTIRLDRVDIERLDAVPMLFGVDEPRAREDGRQPV